MVKKQPGKELILASFGLKVTHITVETLGAMKTCDKVFLSALDDISARPLANYFPDTVSLLHKPWQEQEKILLKFYETGRRAGVIHYGDPDFLCGLTGDLSHFCRVNSIKFTVLRAVSSLPPLLRLLDHERLSGPGVRLVCLKLKNWPDIKRTIDPDIPTFIFEPDALTGRQAARLRTAFLAELKKLYPADRMCALASAANLTEMQDAVIYCDIASLEKFLSRITPRTTLYIAGKNDLS